MAGFDPDIQDAPDLHSASEEYERRFAGEVGSWMLARQSSLLLQAIGDRPPTKILDVGGGHGQNVELLLEHGHQVTVVGSSEGALRGARNFSHPNLRCEIAPLLRLPFSEQSFDVVVSFRIVAHMQDWQRFLQELCRVAKHKIIIDYPTYRSVNIINKALFSAKKQIEANTRRFLTFHDADVEAVLSQAGFSPAKRLPQFFFPMALHRLVRKRSFSQCIERGAQLFGLTHAFGSPVIFEAERKASSSFQK